MKKILGIVVLGLLWCNVSFGVENCKGNNHKKWNKCYGHLEYEIVEGIKQNFYGFWINGKPDGKTITIYKHGAFFSNYKNGKKNGKFIQVNHKSNFANGLIRKYTYKNNEEIEKFSYPSCLASGQGNNPAKWKNCFGKATLNDGSFYYGEFTNEGVAYIKFSSKNKMPNAIYIGEIKNGNINGFGILEFPNGDKHYGVFKNFKPNGIGVSYYSDGKIVRGIWKDFELQ